MTTPGHNQKVSIACGGTGGHLFPGLAVAEALRSRGCDLSLIISEKAVDREAVATVRGMDLLALPAVGLTRGNRLRFVRGFIASYLKCLSHFRRVRPDIVLAMGGFTSAPPLLAGRAFGARCFLHESNSIPGKANRWLSRFVSESFIGFPSAAAKLRSGKVTLTGTPVRAEFFSLQAGQCRRALGLNPSVDVVLVMGGSQGAEGINNLVRASIPTLGPLLRAAQWIHVSGAASFESLRRAYQSAGLNAQVFAFTNRMDLALGAATVAVSRAGASSMAEIAAARLPSILVPYPSAADNHQYFNARAYSDTGAAFLLEQGGATPQQLTRMLESVLSELSQRERMRLELGKWQAPKAAERIAEIVLRSCDATQAGGGRAESQAHAKPEAGPNRERPASRLAETPEVLA